MYSVLIVDDEILSRLGVVNLVDWKANGFTLVGHVGNGSEALKIIRDQMVDLVITDIKMPVMSGIELIERAHEEKHKCAFIVLSSFDDYAYVREAMKLGALDYILKLDMEKTQMETLLANAKEVIDSVKNPSEGSQIVEQSVMNNAKSEFLKQLLYGRHSSGQEIMNKLNDYNLALPYSNFCVLMFKADRLEELLGEGSIRQVIEGALADNKFAYITDTGYDELSILCNFKGNSANELRQAIQRLGTRITYIMKQYFNQKVQIFASHYHKLVEEVPLAYLEVCQAYSLRSYASEEAIIYLNEVINNRNFTDYQSYETSISAIEQALKEIDESALNMSFDGLITHIVASKYVELSQMRHIISSMIYITNRYMNRYGFVNESLWSEEEEKNLLEGSFQRKEDFIDFLTKLKVALGGTMMTLEDNHIIRAVKKYLNEHYRENVIIKNLPDGFGVTSSYMSMLFKKETGVTLKEYLINLKIDHAKKLLKNSNQQISEIAEYIGYDNEHYFSRLFKRKVGMTPSQYRNIL